MGYARQFRDAQKPAANSPLLRIEGLSKSFGQAPPIDLTFSIGEDEIVGLISGGSAAFDLISGVIRPTSGSIEIVGQDVTERGRQGRIGCGIVRGTLLTTLFLDLTALENVLLGGGTRLPPMFPRRGGKTYSDEASEVLEFAGLGRLRDSRAADLSTCQQRFLMVAVALAAKPALLLLDNPGAGLATNALFLLASLIADIRSNGTSVFIAEHDTGPLTEVCDRVLVLDGGRIIADDTPWIIGPVRDAHSTARNS
jgi:branched-chain amino acid transport system ATP-binding protein